MSNNTEAHNEQSGQAQAYQPDASPQLITTEREMFIHWLLRCYHTLNRPSWGEGWTDSETSDALVNVLANIGYDPNLSAQAQELLARQPVYYVSEAKETTDRLAFAHLELKAVYRGSGIFHIVMD